jgi:hypothetical protein
LILPIRDRRNSRPSLSSIVKVKIMLIIELSASPLGRNGNRYHVARIMNRQAGKQVLLNLDDRSHLRLALPILFGSSIGIQTNCHVYQTTIPIRKLRALRKHALSAGCTGPEIAQMIHSELSPIAGIVD